MSVPKTREEVYAEIKRRIVSRDPGYQPGQQLPLQQTLADEFGVHRVTIARIMTDLAGEGLVVGRGRRGTWVPDEEPA